MKIKSNYVLTRVADSWVAVPIGSGNVDLNTIITLNETGAFLWNSMKEETDREALLAALLAEYDVEKEQAERDIDSFLEKVTEAGLAE